MEFPAKSSKIGRFAAKTGGFFVVLGRTGAYGLNVLRSFLCVTGWPRLCPRKFADRPVAAPLQTAHSRPIPSQARTLTGRTLSARTLARRTLSARTQKYRRTHAAPKYTSDNRRPGMSAIGKGRGRRPQSIPMQACVFYGRRTKFITHSHTAGTGLARAGPPAWLRRTFPRAH